MEKILPFFYWLPDEPVFWRSYFVYGGVVLALFGLAWLKIRTKITNLNTRRKWSSLIFALALTPWVLHTYSANHSTAGIESVFVTLVWFRGFVSPLALGVGLGLILFVWALLFAVRSLFAKFYIRFERNNPK